MTDTIPIVNYLVLDAGPPHLVAQECTNCQAHYLSTRLACARCGKLEFVDRRLPDTGTVGSFTIIHRAAPGVPTPFVSALVDLDDGTTVKSSVVDCPPDPSSVTLHMPVKLTTFEAGTDDSGVTAIAFAFCPVHSDSDARPKE